MATQGPNSPGTVVNVDKSSGTAWANPSNAVSSNNSYTTNTSDGIALPDWLKATNFGFTIPTTATIDGILIEIEVKQSSGAFVSASDLHFTKDGSTVLGDNITSEEGDGGTVTTTDAYLSWGGATYIPPDVSFTPSEVNSANFGLFFSMNNAGDAGDIAYVDHIRITVYYTDAAGNTGSFFNMF